MFPLSGVVLLPGGHLPLNIFEPRYLAMVDDALAADRMIGMIQPLDGVNPGPDDDPPPPLYEVGGGGRITAFDETDDGRYQITLTGVCRFRVVAEVPTVRGYRRVEADWAAFAEDLKAAETVTLDRPRLTAALTAYFRKHGISANWEAIKTVPDEQLVTSLSMICPFGPSEKQALLETPTLADRADTMLSLIEMDVHTDLQDAGSRH
ncbi:MAG: LON peptidase substrate-binding domain-containing protein [Inquilinaceae bacterium]